MPGRHQQSAGGRAGLRWLVAAAGLMAAGAMVIAVSPASASTTVNAQLSLSGVATKDNIAGGSEIGIHPGDKVSFKASALPTAGLENIPVLGTLLNGTLDGLLGSQFQVVVTFPSGFPGGAGTLALGGPTTGTCKGAASKLVSFPNKGSFSFSWKVQYIVPGLLGCSKKGLNGADFNALKSAGVALNASNSWVGKIVVADNPPKGGISVQLPGLKLAPSLPVLGQLPTLSVPGLTLPTIKVAIPNLLPSHGRKPGTGHSSSGSTPSTGPNFGPPPVTVPERVVPKGDGGFGGGGGFGIDAGVLPESGSQISNISPLLSVASANSAARAHSATQDSTGKNKTIDLAASNKPPSAQLPVVLAILAIIALSLVAATYARLFLLRRGT